MNASVSLRRAVLLCCLVLVCRPQSAAQTSKDAEDATPRIQLNVNRILVPVVARDKQGRAVADLKKEDFQVFDNDQARPVSAFTVEKRRPTNSAAAGSTESAQAPSLPNAPAQSAPAPQRFIVFLFDDMHLASADLEQVKKAGLKVLAGALAAPDYAAVVSLSGKTNSSLTRDRAKLQDALNSLQSRSLFRMEGSDCPSLSYYQADLIENKHDSAATQDAVRKVLNCNPGMDPKYQQNIAETTADSAARRMLTLGHQDVQSTFAAITAVVHGMAALPGERTLILVSPGFLTIEQDTLSMESSILNLAAQSNVTISALDARGLYSTELTAQDRSPALAGPSFVQNSDYRRSAETQAENPLASLADGSGGAFFHNSNDVGAGFERLAETPEVVYVLELSLDNLKPDGKYHRLKVKVDREGLELQARRGYFMDKPQKSQK